MNPRCAVGNSGLLILGLTLLCQATGLGQTIVGQVKLSEVATIDSTLSFRGIFALSTDEVWVSGTRGAIFYTLDAGRSFQRITIPSASELDFRDLHFSPDSTLLAMSVGSGSASRIYKSTDAGVTWHVTFENEHKNGFLNSLAFWDDLHGIAVGDPIKGHSQILLTSDGGDQWIEVAPERIPKALPNEHNFAASGTSVAVVGKDHAWIGTGGVAARILKTSDRGQNWQVYETPLLSGLNSAGIFSVYFRNADEGFIAGGDYANERLAERTIAFSQDGGVSWQLASGSAIPFQSSISELLVGDARYLLSTGPAGTFASLNGERWQSVSTLGYHCLSVSPDGSTAWLAGSAGRIAKVQ